MAPLRRFYFEIKEANVLDYVTASTFLEAKQEATREYMQFWQQISWIGCIDSATAERPAAEATDAYALPEVLV